MSDIAFLDTECLGLDPAAPIWEFAAVTRRADGTEGSTQFCIRHDPAHWIETLPPAFQDDYRARYTPHDAMPERSAALMIHIVTRGAEIVACNPGFDIERLAALLRRHGIEPAWHYHPWDIASVALGFVCGRDGAPPGRPWKSDRLADLTGITTADYRRHTAMGDVQWTLAQWDAVMGTPAACDCGNEAHPSWCDDTCARRGTQCAEAGGAQ